MSQSVANLISKLVVDPWRSSCGFSTDISGANDVIFAAAGDEDRQAKALNEWISKHQPCLFGRATASKGALAYCILNETDVERGDDFLRDRIQTMRREWRRSACKGGASGFVILLASQRVATAQPDENLAELARKICQLYLRIDEIAFNTVYHEHVFLDIPGWSGDRRMWNAGVNYFSSQGDGRWWADHRIPGGLAFSVNSVGHLISTGKVDDLMEFLVKEFPPFESADSLPLRSPADALRLAMMTIASASDARSGPATALRPLLEEKSDSHPRCPIDKLPARLVGMDHCTYTGYYHTDQTLPREYFSPAVERPAEVEKHNLDFTYLFHESVENPAFETMSQGVPIRATDGPGAGTRPALAQVLSKMQSRPISKVDSDSVIEGTGRFS